MNKTSLTQLICPGIVGSEKRIVSIIGGGGKSTLMEKLSKELVQKGLKVVVTSTTKFQIPQGTALVLQDENSDYIQEAKTLLRELNVVAIAKAHYKDKSRLIGVKRADITGIRQLADVVLIEADGSRQRGLKTHKEYEPVIPSSTQTTIIVVSAETVGQPLDARNVHRAELFSSKWDLPLGSKLTPQIIARELLSPYSYLRNIPLNSTVSFFINKSDINTIGGKMLAEKLAHSCDHNIYLGSLKKNQLKRISLKSANETQGFD